MADRQWLLTQGKINISHTGITAHWLQVLLYTLLYYTVKKEPYKKNIIISTLPMAGLHQGGTLSDFPRVSNSPKSHLGFEPRQVCLMKALGLNLPSRCFFIKFKKALETPGWAHQWMRR